MSISKEEIEALKMKKRSILYPLLDDIRTLRESGVSLRGIRTWVKDQNVESTIENIRLFCKRNKIFILSQTKQKIEKSTHNVRINERKTGSKISFLNEE